MKKIYILIILVSPLFFWGCVPVQDSTQDEIIETIEESEREEDEFIVENMNEEFVYFNDLEPVNPIDLFATIDKDGVLSPQEFYAKKGDYVLLKIMNNSKEEHAIIIPEYGWRTILHKGKETEFGFRAREAGVFPFHCSEYCTEKEHHIRGTIYVE